MNPTITNKQQSSVEQPSKKSLFDLTTVLPELKQVEEKLYQVVKTDSITEDLCSYLINSGGKRLRPVLVLLAGKCASSKANDLITAAVSAELIHMASLVHDDIIDHSHKRRGKSTINYSYGNKPAVLTGDYLFAKAFAILTEEKQYSVLALMVDAIQAMCDGEINQALSCFDLNENVSTYIDRIDKKTGKLITACCEAGAIVNDATAEEREALREYGRHIGIAFQIADDILDFTGTNSSLGKPANSDLSQGILTLPILHLLQDKKHGKWLKNHLEKKQLAFVSQQQLIHALEATGALKASYAAAYQHIQKAKQSLTRISPSPYRGILEGLADMVLSRNN